MKKTLLAILPLRFLGGRFGCNNTETSVSQGKTSEGNTPSTVLPSDEEKEIDLGSSVLGNWGFRTAEGKTRTDNNQNIEVYVDSETKFHFTITQYYESFAPSVFTYEGQITGIVSGVGSCFAVFANSYLSHGAVKEEATTAASAQFSEYKNTISDIYEGESQFQITFHRLRNDVYDNGYITVDKTERDLSFGVFDAVDNAKIETASNKKRAQEIALGSSVIGNWGYQTAGGKKLTDGHEGIEVYVDSETKFHFTVKQYYENFAPSLFTYEGQITGIVSGVGSCFAVFANSYLSHGAVKEDATTAASAQFKAYATTIAEIYEGESQFQITFHRLNNDVYDNGYITVDKTERDLSFGTFGVIDA